jgi:phenylacetate-coenzyme A ligase PaaK-like adenylate-forming protein
MENELEKQIFEIDSLERFNHIAVRIFQFQTKHNLVYKNYVDSLNINPVSIKNYSDIPFLPIQFFKNHEIVSCQKDYELSFSSSGTTSNQPSIHYICNKNMYEESYIRTFNFFYGNITDYCIMALLPSYLERKNSSLVYMVSDLIQQSNHPKSGFYLYNHTALAQQLEKLEAEKQKTILFGVSYALLDFSEQFKIHLKNTTIIETGGMKGNRKEIPKQEYFNVLRERFQTEKIHSEYGMTELLSQAYATNFGIYKTMPWMKILIRQTNDPFEYPIVNQTGGINIIDLANIYSCSFIETQDLGIQFDDGSFDVRGRFDNSEIRGCNLLIGS